MKQSYLNITIFICVLLSVSAQQMPIDFEDAADNFVAFSNSGFAFNTDPQDGSNSVGQFFNDGSQEFQGFYLDLNQSVDLDFQQTLSLEFYSFDPNSHNIILKLENGSNPDVQVVQSFAVPSPSDWITLNFDFANAQLSSDGTPINATGSYDRITIFIDGGNLISGTYLIDNISDGSTPTDPNAIDVVYTDLVWSDEFDIDGPVDSSKWFHQTILPNGVSWFNGEVQHYTNRIENSYVDQGSLNIVAIRENFTDQGQTKEFTSARLNSKFAFTYGRVDVRAKLPFGDGTWPAIWMLGKNIIETGGYWSSQYGSVFWPECGEIDIMEHGLGPVNWVSSALHSPCAGCFGATSNFEYFVLNDVANEFHVYSVNWSPDQITFLIDGVGFYTYNPAVKNDDTWPFYQDQYLLLNIAMGGVAGTIDPSFTQSNMEIDYVRVYQNTLSTPDQVERKFVVSPNPADNLITIRTQEKIDAIYVFDVLGQQVLEKYYNLKHINVSELNSGMYILKIQSGNRIVSKKIIVN